MDKVASLGCAACESIGYQGTPAEIHHVRFNAGMGQRASNFDIIPLCHHHHRNGGYGEAYHAGRIAWEESFGTEKDILERVNKQVGVLS